MERLQIQLTAEQVQRLRRRAAERGVSLAALVRESVEAYLVEEPGTDRQRAIAVIGRFRSSHHDVAARHDDYLAEDFA